MPFSLAEVLDKKSEVPLQPRDTIIIYSRFDMMDQPVVKAAGKVRKPDTYPFVDQMRVSDLIIAAGGLTVEAYLPEAHLTRLLRVGESDSLHSTLLKVNLAGIVDNPADENNLELKPYDELVVFPHSNFILPKKVSVYGAVKQEGDYELTGNMSVRDLVNQAQGLTRNSYKVSVEVVRRKIVGDSNVVREVHQVPFEDAMSGKLSFVLQDGDGIYVREVVNSRERASASVAGEFNFPGRYEFAVGEKLSNLIKRAGGFSPEAYLRGMVFIRKSVKAQQLRHIEDLNRRLESQLEIMRQRTVDVNEQVTIKAAIENRKNVLNDIRNAPYLGRVVVEIDRELQFAGTDWDITLENGDSLWIGQKPNTVSIMGEVYSPTTLIFTSQSNTVGECLEKAGGVSEYGDYNNTYYVAPDGTIATPNTTPWYSSYEWKRVEPGGTIIVPPKGPKKDYLDAITKISQIIFNTAVSVGVVATFF